MSEPQRGNTTHGPNLDEQMEQETRGLVQGHGDPHAEPFRETEPLPDDTDDPAVRRSFRADPLDPDRDQLGNEGGDETGDEGEEQS